MGCDSIDCGPERSDVIAFDNPFSPDVVYIKRVIAIAGDEVIIDPSSNEVHINGEVIDEPYLTSQASKYPAVIRTRVPKDHVWVMGDNRDESIDSRVFGSIPMSDLIGKVILSSN